MIAVGWKRGCWRIIAASSKPSRSGMQTSTRTTAIVVLAAAARAPRCAELALISFSPSSPRIDLVAEELRRLVVDQQDVDLIVGCSRRLLPAQRCSHIRSADSSCSVLTGLAR